MRLPTLFAAVFSTSMLLAAPLPGEPAARLDRAQGEAALRLIDEGDTVRLYCKPCSDVAYTAVTVRSRELSSQREHYELVLNGEGEDPTRIYVDDGYGEGWQNLAVMLGLVTEGPVPKLPLALDDVARLAPHAGSYTGEIGGRDARFDLVLTGRKLDGSWVRVEDSLSFEVLATAYNLTRGGETLTLVERANGRVTATLYGELDAANGTFTGKRTPLGESAGEPQPFRLTKVP